MGRWRAGDVIELDRRGRRQAGSSDTPSATERCSVTPHAEHRAGGSRRARRASRTARSSGRCSPGTPRSGLVPAARRSMASASVTSGNRRPPTVTSRRRVAPARLAGVEVVPDRVGVLGEQGRGARVPDGQ